jgi:hypothetical protein
MRFKTLKRVASLRCFWRYGPLLSPYIDGELDERRRALVERHIARCEGCRAESEDLSFASRALLRLAMSVEAPRPAPFSFDKAASAGSARGKSVFGLTLSRLMLSPASAALAAIFVGLCALWYYTHPSNWPWEVARLAGSPTIGRDAVIEKGQLGEGQWLETDGASRARVSVGGIGYVEVEPNTRLRMIETRMTEHRLELERGKLQATIWAPPKLFFVDTPSAEAVDLGCAYTLEVDYDGTGRLHVSAGWVALVLKGRESKVPAGAVCVTRVGAGPGTPYFEDAPENFRDALTKFDFENGGSPSLDLVLREARARDTLTLYHLLARVSEPDRGRVYGLLAQYAPPPAGVTREGVLQLDKGMLDDWRKELESAWVKESMPTVKKIWRWIWS